MANGTMAGWRLTSPIPKDPVYDKRGFGLQSSRADRKQRSRSSPIPVDPVYANGMEDSHNAAPRPRVKPEAINIARLHQGGALAQLFNPAFRVIPIGSRPKTQEGKNFGKENYQKIKEIQKANKEKQKESARGEPMKAIYKPRKFDHVESKVAEAIQAPPTAPRPNSTDYLKAHSKSGPKVNVDKRPASAEPVVPRIEKLSIPRASSARQVRIERKPVNHVAENARKAKSIKMKRAPSLNALDDLKKKQESDMTAYKRGNVPKYLKTRQERWKKEEETRLANIPDPSIPPGHSLMPDDERRKTLALLNKSQDEMLRELQSLPVSKDTLRVKQRKEHLEKKLQEVDTAVKIFSRPKVFVKDE